MNTAMKLTETRVEVVRTFEAPRSLVFAAWVDPERAKQWAGCEGSEITSMTIDLRVGGEGRTTMLIPGAGGPMTAVAKYTEVDPPNRIAYRLSWEPAREMAVPETQVKVSFEEVGERTRVRLVHEGLMSSEMEANVKEGWSGSLERFETAMRASAVGQLVS